jgi:hypothetical protein
MFEKPVSTREYLMWGGGAAVLIGSFLPWASAFGGLAEKKGTEGDGVITLVCGIAMLLLGYMWYKSGNRNWKIAYIVAAGLAAIVAVIDIADVGGTEGISIGYGLWIVLIGAIAGLGALFVKTAGGGQTTAPADEAPPSAPPAE